MTATNHVTTGSVFALGCAPFVPWWIILPVAFLLHFVMDALPHFGESGDEKMVSALNRLKWFLPIDACVAAAVLIIILTVRPAYCPLAVAAGILCASPDLWSVTRFIRFLRSGDPSINKDWFARFHHGLQWGERLWGAWVELAWFACFGFILITML